MLLYIATNNDEGWSEHNHSLLVLEFSRTPFCMSAGNIYHMTLATRHDPEKYQINILILLIYEQ
jgi:hypothetical protein